jgi:uncharacterized protein (TIGR02996 family)
MTDEASWLRAILAAPRDDALRLAFADWLSTQDDGPRAELIRAQIALARPRLLEREERDRLRQRERVLRAENEKRLQARLPVLEGVTWGGVWERGLIAHATIKAGAFARCIQEVFAATAVRSLSILDVDPAAAAALLDRPEIEQLDGLYLSVARSAASRADEVAALVARSPRLARLRNLGISTDPRRGLTDEGARLLAGSPHLARLQRLNLYNNQIGGAGVAALAASAHLTRLRELELTQNTIGDEGLFALARSSALQSLRHIYIYGNKHTDRGVVALMRSPLARQFRDLLVGGGSLSVAAARAIARTPALAGLRVLDLGATDIGDAGLIEIVNSPYLRRLRELCLRISGLSDASVAVLARSPKARRLRILDLEHNALLDVGTWELVRSPHLEGIEQLKLWDCDDLGPTVRLALKERFGARVEVHVGDPEAELNAEGVHSAGPTTGDALLDDVRQNPDDDVPRLVYADWIEEHGELERADFIRRQCRLARCAVQDPERVILTARLNELVGRHGWDWTEGAFLRWLQHPPARCPLREPHGVCEVFAEAVRLRQEEQRLVEQRSPDISQRWKDLARRMQALNWNGQEPALPLFQHWVLQRGFIEHATVAESLFVIFSPAVRDLGMLRQLQLDDDLDAGDYVIRLLIATMERPRLRTLRLYSVVDHLAPLRALAAWRGLEELTELALLAHPEDESLSADEVMRILARSPYLRKLEHLDVRLYPEYSDAAVNAVLDSPYLKGLQQLRLRSDHAELSEAVLARFRLRFGVAHPAED